MTEHSGYIVRGTTFLKKPMVLCHHDGSRDVPDGGILFNCPSDIGPTRFPTEDDANKAIDRTVDHGAAWQYGWRAEDFTVQSYADFIREKNAPRPKRAAKRKDEL